MMRFLPLILWSFQILNHSFLLLFCSVSVTAIEAMRFFSGTARVQPNAAGTGFFRPFLDCGKQRSFDPVIPECFDNSKTQQVFQRWKIQGLIIARMDISDDLSFRNSDENHVPFAFEKEESVCSTCSAAVSYFSSLALSCEIAFAPSIVAGLI